MNRSRKQIITATPPTPNGDLHVGHICGPYLGADILSRYSKLKNTEVLYISYADHNQTYVVTTAKKMNEEPLAIANEYAEKIRETLDLAGISTDTFHNPDAQHNKFVQEFFQNLYAKGKLVSKKKTMLVDELSNTLIFESFLTGSCGTCFAETAGAICENCGHPNDASNIKFPRNSLAPERTLVRREIDIMVLELELYREDIRKFFSEKTKSWRPHLLQLVDELLEKPLPDYPITYISDWGIPAPFPNFEGHVLNVWAEMYPGLIYAAEVAAHKKSKVTDAYSLWSKESNPEIIQFLGYDNSFFFAFVHLALALAHGNIVLPSYIITNEFYEYENFKFSTSKRNLIWGRDLLAEVPKDHVRFYLALSNPEYQKVNFSRPAMNKLLDARLIAPWKKLCDTLLMEGEIVGIKPGDLIGLSDSNMQELQAVIDRFEQFYCPEKFSPQRIAEHIGALLNYCNNYLDKKIITLDMSPRKRVEFVYSLLSCVIPTIFTPLLPDTASRIRELLEMPQVSNWEIKSDLQNLTWTYSKSLAHLI